MEENNILLSLLRNPSAIANKKTTFQWVVDNANIPNRNRCGAILSALIKKGLIREDPKIWKQGQKKFFSLTEEGKRKGMQLAVDSINQGMDILESISSMVNPVQFRTDFDLKEELLWNQMANNEESFIGKSFPEKVNNFLVKQTMMTKPVFESFRKLHKVLTYFRQGEVDFSKYVTIVRGDGSDPITIPLRLLEEIKFGRLFFLSYSKNLQDLKVQWSPKPNIPLPDGIL
jgi:predicted transcriptional regulator